MKKLLSLGVFIVLMLSTVAVGTASAGNGEQVTPFKATYYVKNGFVIIGTPTCEGRHIVGPPAKPFVKDSQTCRVERAGFIAGTYSNGGDCAARNGSNWGYFPPLGCSYWLSDYNGATASRWTNVVTDNGDGTFTEDVVAYY